MIVHRFSRKHPWVPTFDHKVIAQVNWWTAASLQTVRVTAIRLRQRLQIRFPNNLDVSLCHIGDLAQLAAELLRRFAVKSSSWIKLMWISVYKPQQICDFCVINRSHITGHDPIQSNRRWNLSHCCFITILMHQGHFGDGSYDASNSFHIVATILVVLQSPTAFLSVTAALNKQRDKDTGRWGCKCTES